MAASQPLMDWPAHWDSGALSHQVMKGVLANTYEHHGLDAAEVVRERLYDSRSARIGAAFEASRLGDEELAELFRTEGAQHLPSWPCVEAPPDICLEGLLPFRYDDDGEFLHIEREAAAFGVGLRALDYALGDIM